MSFFDKLFIVEKDEKDVQAPVAADVPDDVEVSAVVSSSDGVVSNIYAQNNMADEGNSIYAVSKLINTLPKEMTTPKMQQTIAGILAVTQKSIPALIADAHNRIDVLKAACASIVMERTHEIECANSDIEKLKQAIEVAQKVIKNAEDIREATEKQISDEIEEIEKLIKFSEGMVNAE